MNPTTPPDTHMTHPCARITPSSNRDELYPRVAAHISTVAKRDVMISTLWFRPGGLLGVFPVFTLQGQIENRLNIFNILLLLFVTHLHPSQQSRKSFRSVRNRAIHHR